MESFTKEEFVAKTKKYNNTLNLIFLLVFVLLLISTYIDLKSKHAQLKEQLITLKDVVVDEYKDRLKESLLTTITYIDEVYISYLNEQKTTNPNFGELTEKNYIEFENKIREYLYRNIHDKVRYTWINKIINFEGGKSYAKRLIHPNLKNTEGILLDEQIEDIKGNKPYKIELEGIKSNGEIFYTYFFKQYGSELISEKISYAKFYKKLNWVIATGIPLDVLNKKIEKLEKILLDKYFDYVYFTIVIKILLLIVLAIALFVLKNKTKNYLFENLIESHIELEQANIKLNEATKCGNIGVWKWNLEDEIIEWNDEMFAIYEIENINNELSYKSWLDTIYIDDRENIVAILNESLNGKEKISIEYRIKTKSKVKYIKSTAKIFYKNKKAIYVIGINIDITTIKEFENQQIQMLQQAKLASLGEMIGNIAHQWRQPLSVISTASTGMKLQKEKGILTDELFYSEINTINSNIISLNETIETFRNFILEEKIYAEVSLKDRIYKTFKIINPDLKSHHIKLVHNLESADDVKMKIHIGELSQVLINIMNNAKDALIERKIVEPKIILNFIKNEEYLLITIEDNAGGIPENVIEHVFEPYFTTKHKSVGTGLGLYICYKIVLDSLRGKIYVNNEKEGAKFYIQLFYK